MPRLRSPLLGDRENVGEFRQPGALPAPWRLCQPRQTNGRRVASRLDEDACLPLAQRPGALAIEEAQHLVPKPRIIVLAAFQFDPEAAQDRDETHGPGVSRLKTQLYPRASIAQLWILPDLMDNPDGLTTGPWTTLSLCPQLGLVN